MDWMVRFATDRRITCWEDALTFVPVVLAGGSGERFWPLSRQSRPKQFLNLDGTGRSLLQATADRLLPLSGGHDDLFVVAGQQHRGLILEHIPELPLENLIVEPQSRNTAPAVLLATLRVREMYGEDAIVGVFSSDHRVEDVLGFHEAVNTAVRAVEFEAGIATIGVQPTFPATGYGYIQSGQRLIDGVQRVERFVEKPDLETAETFLARGGYSWNAGIFVFRVSTMLEEFALYAPEILAELEHCPRRELAAAYERLTKVSIDYAVLEKSQRVFVVPSSFGWDDLGDWNALERLLKTSNPNVEIGQHIGLDTNGAILYTTTGEDLIVTIGLEDVVIVRDDQCTLIARKDRTQDIRKLVERMKSHPELKKYV
jgi:mannose-1-phosphate guanylyltransferase